MKGHIECKPDDDQKVQIVLWLTRGEIRDLLNAMEKTRDYYAIEFNKILKAALYEVNVKLDANIIVQPGGITNA